MMETEFRNFVEPVFKCGVTNPSRAVALPPDIPDGALIVGASMSNNNFWGANNATWTLSYDRGGKWTRSANYPSEQYGSFYQLAGLVYLNSPNMRARSGRIDPPIVYRKGDLFIVDLASNGGGNAQPTWQIEFAVPEGNYYPYTYAYGPTTVGGDNGLNTALSLRTLSNPVGGAWSQVRVTLMGGDIHGLACQNVSIGVQDAGPATKSAPVELLFDGDHGFNALATPGALSTSDWTNFQISNGDTLVVIFDGHATQPCAPAFVNTATHGYLTGGSQGSYYKGNAQSYNQSNPSGFIFAPNSTYGLYSIEVR